MSAHPDISSLTLSQLQDLTAKIKQIIQDKKYLIKGKDYLDEAVQIPSKFEESINAQGYYIDVYQKIDKSFYEKDFIKSCIIMNVALCYEIRIDENEEIIVGRSSFYNRDKLTTLLKVCSPCIDGMKLSDIDLCYDNLELDCNRYNLEVDCNMYEQLATVDIIGHVYIKKQPFPPNNKVIIIYIEKERVSVRIISNFTIINGRIIGNDGINYYNNQEWDHFSKLGKITWIPIPTSITIPTSTSIPINTV